MLTGCSKNIYNYFKKKKRQLYYSDIYNNLHKCQVMGYANWMGTVNFKHQKVI